MKQIFEFLLPKHMRTPVAKPLGEPKIIYETRLVNADNIDAWRKCMTYGTASMWRNEIFIYNYEISPLLTLSPDDPIHEKIKDVEERKPDTVAHEMRHIHNGAYREYYGLYDRHIYDMHILNGLDEISAFTYGDGLNGHMPETWDEMWSALCMGIDELVTPHKNYRRRHGDVVSLAFNQQTDGKSDAHKIKRLNKLLVPGPVKYTRGAQIIADYFLTFGDYRVLSPDVAMPTEVKNKLRDFRDEWEALARAELTKIKDDLVR